MEITVDREAMIKEITSEKKRYQEKYEESVETYKKKLREYAKYVERVASESPMERLKNAPSVPYSNTETFENSLEMLNAHVEPKLKMSDHEYRELREGIKSAHSANTSSTLSLNALSYS